MQESQTKANFDSIVHQLYGLVIDDQKTMRGIVRRMLTTIGITQIDEYSDGKGAWDFLTGHTLEVPDFIVCDLHMEGMDGLEFVNKIRRSKNETIRQIPVLILTGDSDKFLHQVADQVGAAKILQKPISAPDLRKEIANILGIFV